MVAWGVRRSAEWGADHSEKIPCGCVCFVKDTLCSRSALVFVDFGFLSVALRRGSAS